MEQQPVVMLVEDTDDDLALAQRAISRSGWPHRVLTFRDGAEVVAHLYNAGRRDPPAFVLLDLKLPKLDGKLVLRELRGNPRTSGVPVIVLTSSRLELDVIDAYKLGAQSYLRKEVDYRRFESAMAVLMAYWLGLNVPPPGSGPDTTPAPHVLRHASLAAVLRGVTPKQEADMARHEIVIVDSDERDVAATREGVLASGVRNPLRTIGQFEEMVDFLRPAGGPPPLLPDNFPRLFIMDVDLDGGDGRDVLQSLRYRADHHAVIVMFTRSRNVHFLSECYRLKVNSVVYKPDDPGDYQETVRLMAHYWIHLNEPPPDPSWSVRALAHPG